MPALNNKKWNHREGQICQCGKTPGMARVIAKHIG